MKDLFMKDLRGIKEGEETEAAFMVLKKLARDGELTIAVIGDKTGDMKLAIPDSENEIKVGDIILIRVVRKPSLEVLSYKKEENFDVDDFIASIDVSGFSEEMAKLSEEEFKSIESRTLDAFFFQNDDFLAKFSKGIGGLSQHHNYRGGLVEHTLNVMYLTKLMAERYNAKNREIAVLAAKLHDIGKIEEYFVDGPFSVTMRGEMEGHIVIGISMLEEAFRAGGDIYSEEFKSRIKGCIVQHHGKLEYGSPKTPNTEEAFIINFADTVDATLNKISQVKGITEVNTWSEYDRRIGTRLYI